jgi:hypothetical protein
MLQDKALCLSLPPQNVLQAEISLAPAYIEEKDMKPFSDLTSPRGTQASRHSWATSPCLR